MKLLVIGPQTRTANAISVLRQNGINAVHQKITETGEGCLHAALVADAEADRAVRVLEKNGVRVKSVMRKS